MWAKSSEDYKTWTDTTGNAFPTSASHTVSGLDRGHEYKVKVRARYSNGSGPWSTEVQHTIPEPTPTPTPEPSDAPHWVSSTMPDHVTMFDWSDVENATGYEIQMAFGSATRMGRHRRTRTGKTRLPRLHERLVRHHLNVGDRRPPRASESHPRRRSGNRLVRVHHPARIAGNSRPVRMRSPVHLDRASRIRPAHFAPDAEDQGNQPNQDQPSTAGRAP